MFRHPHYLDIPWEIHWQPEAEKPHRHLWWLIVGLVLMAMFLMGIGVTSGLV